MMKLAENNSWNSMMRHQWQYPFAVLHDCTSCSPQSRFALGSASSTTSFTIERRLIFTFLYYLSQRNAEKVTDTARYTQTVVRHVPVRYDKKTSSGDSSATGHASSLLTHPSFNVISSEGTMQCSTETDNLARASDIKISLSNAVADQFNDPSLTIWAVYVWPSHPADIIRSSTDRATRRHRPLQRRRWKRPLRRSAMSWRTNRRVDAESRSPTVQAQTWTATTEDTEWSSRCWTSRRAKRTLRQEHMLSHYMFRRPTNNVGLCHVR